MTAALEPAEYRGLERDEVRLLVTDRQTRKHRHARFTDLPDMLRAGDVVVVNDSATLPAALRVRRRNGETMALQISTMIDQRLCTAEPRGTVAAGEELSLPLGGLAVALTPVDTKYPRLWYMSFELPAPMHEYLARAGEPIRYSYVTRRFPLRDYQTLFARAPGSSEMPSAARPFTARVARQLSFRGVIVVPVTLHCGVASFEAPERPATERFTVLHETAEIVNAARRERRRVVAVGTTVVRALESSVRDGRVVASGGWTDLVIDSAHRVQTVDALLTGFHQPTATHLSMLQAFLDPRLLDEAYAIATGHGYYCHEFGDAHLVL